MGAINEALRTVTVFADQSNHKFFFLENFNKDKSSRPLNYLRNHLSELVVEP